MNPIKKKLKVYKLTDLNHEDLRLLINAKSLQPKHFFCYGNSWYKLYSLELIDEDTRVTPNGSSIIKAYFKALDN